MTRVCDWMRHSSISTESSRAGTRKRRVRSCRVRSFASRLLPGKRERLMCASTPSIWRTRLWTTSGTVRPSLFVPGRRARTTGCRSRSVGTLKSRAAGTACSAVGAMQRLHHPCAGTTISCGGRRLCQVAPLSEQSRAHRPAWCAAGRIASCTAGVRAGHGSCIGVRPELCPIRARGGRRFRPAGFDIVEPNRNGVVRAVHHERTAAIARAQLYASASSARRVPRTA